MKSMAFSDIRANFTRVANEIQYHNERYVLMKNNRPAFVMMPVEDALLLDTLVELHEDREDVRLFKERQSEDTTSLNDLWKDLGIK